MKTKKYLYGLVILVAVLGLCYISFNKNEIKTIKSEKQLYYYYDVDGENTISFIKKIVLLPFSIFADNSPIVYNSTRGYKGIDYVENSAVEDAESSLDNVKDYSKTNIQVEGVDEADIIKTDGDYIYSISENNVVITNAKNPNDITIEAKIDNNGIPNDIILYKDLLVIISTNEYFNYLNKNTIVQIYNINNKKNPKLLKSLELYEPYYTTRCIDGKLYIFSSGHLKEENNKVIRDYKEDNRTKEIPLKEIHYIENHKGNIQTLIGQIDLNDLKKVQVQSYLIDISNAYISENNIYLLNQAYDNDDIKIKDLFGIKGVFGIFDSAISSYESKTEIYKFKMSNNGISYTTHKQLEGRTINQYSLDENNNHLRIAIQGEDGTRIEVLDDKLNLIGKTESVARGEDMKASRFIGNKAYLVTYQKTDPLFVIDLKNEKNPQVMGELKIPGYSTYLHPYDDKHLIGIGVDTEEEIIRDDEGKVINNSVFEKGIKMSLFDISDINNPILLAETPIGDDRTVSTVLNNPKALLFSKEKNLIAIPANRYKNELFDQSYTGESYLVYHIDLKGFKLKGIIEHDKSTYRYQSKQLRGLYIDNNLFTVSESTIKVHDLEDLKELKVLKLTEKDV